MRRKLIAITLLALCTGCMNTQPSAGDRMIDQAEGTDALGKQWNEGAELAERASRERERAQRALSNAEDEIPRARAALARAEQDLQRAQAMMRNAEEEFARRFPGRSLRDANSR